MSTRFKLKFDDLVRKVSFTKQPTWSGLSAKISALYGIPQDQVGVTYLDAENEEITLNTEDELQDYYYSSHRTGETIKFSVRDLSSRNRRPTGPAGTGIRNTFGQFIDPEIPGIDEWQSVNDIPSLEEIIGHASPPSEVRSAFVESVVSDGSTIGKGADHTFGPGHTVDARSETSEPRISSEEKGKERAHFVRSVSSTQSLLASDIGDKHPVHVYDVSSLTRSPPVHGFSLDGAGTAIAAESTPRVSTSILEQGSTFGKRPEHTQETDDPPVPALESTDSQPAQAADATGSAQSDDASASLARDVTSFLNTVGRIISSHPELSESLRTIARNTTNGAYWASHRESLSQAAREFQRSTENLAEDGRRVVEEEAGRRVAEALAGVLRIFSQAQASMEGGDTAQTFNVPSDSGAQPPEDPPARPPPAANPPPADPPHSQTPPIPGAFAATDFATGFGGSFPFGRRHGWHGWRARASMPPNFVAGGGAPRWTMPFAHSPFGPYPPFGPDIDNSTWPTAPPQRGRTPYFTPTPGPDPGPKPDHISPETSTSTEGNERHSPQELKAKVEEAKRAYKVEKERYRRERDERRKERDQDKTPKKEEATTNNSQNPDVPTSSDHIATHARHGFPRFDIVNVTDPSHHRRFPRRHERPADDLFTRAVNRIGRRLADMGFTEKAYPDLPEKIKNHLPSNGSITKDSEDDIVTTLLESMLAAPKSPVASGSGPRVVPGGWP